MPCTSPLLPQVKTLEFRVYREGPDSSKVDTSAASALTYAERWGQKMTVTSAASCASGSPGYYVREPLWTFTP